MAVRSSTLIPFAQHVARRRIRNPVAFGIHNLTADAVLLGKKDLVIQALLVALAVTALKRVPELVDHMIEKRSP